MKQTLKEFSLALIIVVLQVLAVSACTLDQATAYQVITGEVR